MSQRANITELRAWTLHRMNGAVVVENLALLLDEHEALKKAVLDGYCQLCATRISKGFCTQCLNYKTLAAPS